MLGINFRSLLYINLLKVLLIEVKFSKNSMFIYLIKLKIYSDLFIKKNKYDYRKGYIKSNKIVVVIDENLINGY